MKLALWVILVRRGLESFEAFVSVALEHSLLAPRVIHVDGPGGHIQLLGELLDLANEPLAALLDDGVDGAVIPGGRCLDNHERAVLGLEA